MERIQPRPSNPPYASTEQLLADAQRLHATLIDASSRLSAFTEMLREMLHRLPPEGTDTHDTT